jgi:hypothetical protein
MMNLTQMEKARLIRAQLLEHFPELDELRNELVSLLGKAQNAPPHGEVDGSLSEVQYNQLRFIEQALQKFLSAQLFDTRPSPFADQNTPSRRRSVTSDQPDANRRKVMQPSPTGSRGSMGPKGHKSK